MEFHSNLLIIRIQINLYTPTLIRTWNLLFTNRVREEILRDLNKHDPIPKESFVYIYIYRPTQRTVQMQSIECTNLTANVASN